MSRILERTEEGTVSILSFEMSEIEIKKITTIIIILFDCVQTKSGIGPICWMAPESIRHRNYSKKSDIWSFGIVGL
jgi:serine/threonine protein kinase